MRINTSKRSARSGAAAVEFAVVLTLLVPLLIGVWEIGRLVNAYQVASNAARDAGRRAATGETTGSEVEAFVLDYLQSNGFTKLKSVASTESELSSGGKVYINIKIFDKNGAPVAGDPKFDAEQMYRIEITVKILFDDIELSPTNLFLKSDYTISATAVWHSMKDIPVTVNQNIPLS